jgi:hypothetical protein
MVFQWKLLRQTDDTHSTNGAAAGIFEGTYRWSPPSIIIVPVFESFVFSIIVVVVIFRPSIVVITSSR